jgi:hypothetical protein
VDDWVARWNRLILGLARGPSARAVLADLADLRRIQPDDTLATALAERLAALGDDPVPGDLAFPDWPGSPRTDLS